MLNIGIDIGWTIKGFKPHNDKNIPSPGSFDIITELIQRNHNIFLISKVNSEQKQKVEEWLKIHDFFNITKVKPENLYFCFERKDKSLFVKALNIDIMIDDRPEVLVHLPYNTTKILINPDIEDLKLYKNQLDDIRLVSNWYQIANFIYNKPLPEPLSLMEMLTLPGYAKL